MAITATGLGSGLDVKSLVDQLVAAERQPAATRLATQEARANAQLTAIGRLKGALSTFQTAVTALADPAQFQQRKATVSDEDYVAGLTRQGVPENAARLFLTLFRAARDGEFAVTDPTLETLVGRPSTTLRSVLEEHLSRR